MTCWSCLMCAQCNPFNHLRSVRATWLSRGANACSRVERDRMHSIPKWIDRRHSAHSNDGDGWDDDDDDDDGDHLTKHSQDWFAFVQQFYALTRRIERKAKPSCTQQFITKNNLSHQSCVLFLVPSRRCRTVGTEADQQKVFLRARNARSGALFIHFSVAAENEHFLAFGSPKISSSAHTQRYSFRIN